MSEELPGHANMLDILARCEAMPLRQIAETLLDDIEDVDVIENRTGLVMLPMRDTVKGTAFHLGEVLMSEAHIRMLGREGYGMRRGRDLETVMAMAVVDAAWQAGHERDRIESFVGEQAERIAAEEEDLLRDIEATRVNMETF